MEKEDQKKISDPSEIPNENVDEICVKPEASTEFSAEEQNPNIKITTDMDVPEDKVDTEAGKCDDDQMETASTDNPFAYLERGDFSSERFKLELCNLPPRFGLSQLKKKLVHLGLKPCKIKSVSLGHFAFVTFRTEEDKNSAIDKLQGYEWKSRKIKVKMAAAIPDPLVVKRQSNKERKKKDRGTGRIEEFLDDDSKVNATVSPLWQMPYEQQLELKTKAAKDCLVKLARKICTNNSLQIPFINLNRSRHDGVCCELGAIKPSPVTQAYRNKCEFTIGRYGELDNCIGFRVGSYKQGDLSVLPVLSCSILPPAMKTAVEELRAYLQNHVSHMASFSALTRQGYWKQAIVRTASCDHVQQQNDDAQQQQQHDATNKQQQHDSTTLQQPAVRSDTSGSEDKEQVNEKNSDVNNNNTTTESNKSNSTSCNNNKLNSTNSSSSNLNSGSSNINSNSSNINSNSSNKTNNSGKQQVMLTLVCHPQSLSEEEKRGVVAGFKAYYEGLESSVVTSLHFLFQSDRCSDTANEQPQHLAGSAHITETLLNLHFQISPLSFFQVNTKAAEVLYAQVASLCQASERTTVVDVCCGTGTIALCLAKGVRRVVGIEVVKEAVDNAKANAALNGVTNAEFICGKVETVLDPVLRGLKDGEDEVVVVVDPPRAGLHDSVVKAIRRVSAVRRLVYVACKLPAACNNILDFTRQPSKRTQGKAFRLTHTSLVDLFPMTDMYETVMLLQREYEENEEMEEC